MNTKRISFLATLAALAVSGLTLAADLDPEAKAAAQHVAVLSCGVCHGPQGRSTTPKFPVLAGQHASYLIAQLKAFKAQTRGDPDALGYMWGMAAPLNDDSKQSPATGHGGDAATIARGAEIFSKGIAAEGIPPCISCHGPNAAGTDDFPRLAGQHSQYLLKQLRSFQSNLRNMAVMHGVASELKTNEMSAVAAYLQSLSGS